MSSQETTPSFTTWESYFYPETYDPTTKAGTLINVPGERDAGVLERLEYGLTAKRQMQLELGVVEIPKTFDAQHVRAIHQHLFQDVYPWAGEYRGVDISKGLSRFPRADIERYVTDTSRIIRETPWASLDQVGFATKAAEVYAYLNQAHPFREGNGRAGKMFMQHVSELSNFYLDFDPGRSGVSRDAWNSLSAHSAPNLGEYKPDPSVLVPVFHRYARPAANGPLTTLPPDPELGRESNAAQQRVNAIRGAMSPTRGSGEGRTLGPSSNPPPWLPEKTRSKGYER